MYFELTSTDVKALIKEKCGLMNVIADNPVSKASGNQITIGLADEEDAAVIMKVLNGYNLGGCILEINKFETKTNVNIPPPKVQLHQQFSNYFPNNISYEAVTLNSEQISVNKQKMTTSDQQLMAACNQQIPINNQIMPMSDQQMDMCNQQIPLNNQMMPMSDQQMAVCNQQIPINNQMMPMSDQQMTVSDQQIPINNQMMPMSDQQTPVCNQQIPINNQMMPMSDQQIAVCNQQIPINNQMMPMSDQQMAVCNQQIPINNQMMATFNQNMPINNKQMMAIFNLQIPANLQQMAISNDQTSMSDQLISMINQQMAMVNQQTPIGNQQMAMVNQQTSIGNRQMAMVNQQILLSHQQIEMGDQQIAMANQLTPMGNQQMSMNSYQIVITNQQMPPLNQPPPVLLPSLPNSSVPSTPTVTSAPVTTVTSTILKNSMAELETAREKLQPTVEVYISLTNGEENIMSTDDDEDCVALVEHGSPRSKRSRKRHRSRSDHSNKRTRSKSPLCDVSSEPRPRRSKSPSHVGDPSRTRSKSPSHNKKPCDIEPSADHNEDESRLNDIMYEEMRLLSHPFKTNKEKSENFLQSCLRVKRSIDSFNKDKLRLTSDEISSANELCALIDSIQNDTSSEYSMSMDSLSEDSNQSFDDVSVTMPDSESVGVYSEAAKRIAEETDIFNYAYPNHYRELFIKNFHNAVLDVINSVIDKSVVSTKDDIISQYKMHHLKGHTGLLKKIRESTRIEYVKHSDAYDPEEEDFTHHIEVPTVPKIRVKDIHFSQALLRQMYLLHVLDRNENVNLNYSVREFGKYRALKEFLCIELAYHEKENIDIDKSLEKDTLSVHLLNPEVHKLVEITPKRKSELPEVESLTKSLLAYNLVGIRRFRVRNMYVALLKDVQDCERIFELDSVNIEGKKAKFTPLFYYAIYADGSFKNHELRVLGASMKTRLREIEKIFCQDNVENQKHVKYEIIQKRMVCSLNKYQMKSLPDRAWRYKALYDLLKSEFQHHIKNNIDFVNTLDYDTLSCRLMTSDPEKIVEIIPLNSGELPTISIVINIMEKYNMVGLRQFNVKKMYLALLATKKDCERLCKLGELKIENRVFKFRPLTHYDFNKNVAVVEDEGAPIQNSSGAKGKSVKKVVDVNTAKLVMAKQRNIRRCITKRAIHSLDHRRQFTGLKNLLFVECGYHKRNQLDIKNTLKHDTLSAHLSTADPDCMLEILPAAGETLPHILSVVDALMYCDLIGIRRFCIKTMYVALFRTQKICEKLSKLESAIIDDTLVKFRPLLEGDLDDEGSLIGKEYSETEDNKNESKNISGKIITVCSCSEKKTNGNGASKSIKPTMTKANKCCMKHVGGQNFPEKCHPIEQERIITSMSMRTTQPEISRRFTAMRNLVKAEYMYHKWLHSDNFTALQQSLSVTLKGDTLSPHLHSVDPEKLIEIIPNQNSTLPKISSVKDYLKGFNLVGIRMFKIREMFIALLQTKEDCEKLFNFHTVVIDRICVTVQPLLYYELNNKGTLRISEKPTRRIRRPKKKNRIMK